MMDTVDDGGGTNTGTVEATTTPVENNTTPVNELEIEGLGKVKIDDLKEWKQGYMRQSDYTRKTQEVAQQRKEVNDALEVYNYLKSNPHVAQALSQGDVSALQTSPVASKLSPQNKQFEDVNFRLATMELDNTLNRLKATHKDFDEIEVLKEAERIGVTDLEFVYNSIRGKNVDDIEARLTKKIEEELTEKIRKNGITTQTTIDPKDTSSAPNHGLSPEQIAIATKMKLTPEQYAKGLK